MSCFFERRNTPANFIEIANSLFRHLNMLRENSLIDFDVVNIESLLFEITADQLKNSKRERELAESLLRDYAKDIKKFKKIENPTLDYRGSVGVTMMIRFLKDSEKASFLIVNMGGERETFLFTGFPCFKDNPGKYFSFFYNQIMYLDPMYGYIDAAIISGKQNLPEFFFGWMNYFSNALNIPPIPGDYEVEEIPERGKVIVTTRDFFDPKNNVEHYDKAMRLVELFREYNIVRPKLL